MTSNSPGKESLRLKARAAGFSLFELCVAMAIFLIVGGTAMTLFSRHEALLSQEQGTAGLNIGLRNALSQIQMDLVNAGSGLVPGAASVTSWPVGVIIVNSNPNASPVCSPATTGTYTANCFDSMTIVMVDPKTPYLQLGSSYTSAACLNTTGEACGTSNVVTTEGTTTVTGALPSGYSAATYASNFKNGDQVLFVDVSSSGQSFTVATLTAAGSASGSSNVVLTFDETQPGGYNYGATSANDPLGMTTPYCYVSTTSGSTTVTQVSGNTFPPDRIVGSTPINSAWDGESVQICNNSTGVSTCTSYTVSTVPSTTSLTLTSAPTATLSNAPFFFYTTYSTTNSFFQNDFVLRLLPIQYSVSEANASDPQLVRTQAGTPNTVMDQVIGFKVGATWWNNPLEATEGNFGYDYNSVDYGNNFSLVRAVRVSIIGRTTPSTDPTYTYTNPFDGGRYQIRGSSIVVNPRNLTMSND
jgi:Tfp pilus assembly protein PilW